MYVISAEFNPSLPQLDSKTSSSFLISKISKSNHKQAKLHLLKVQTLIKNNIPQAMEECRKAIAIDPQCQKAYYKMAKLLIKQGLNSEAASYIV